jgi:putative PIN family toxin of toxin-antitoxin system
VILDTNVFISGVFFSGPPHQILKLWRDEKIRLVVSEDILEEYERVGEALSEQFPGIDLRRLLDLVTIKAELFKADRLPTPVCEDPDDDKFLSCALVSKTKVIVSGDKHLLKVSNFLGIRIMTPRQFLEETSDL